MRALAVHGEGVTPATLAKFLGSDVAHAEKLGMQLTELGCAQVTPAGIRINPRIIMEGIHPEMPIRIRRTISRSWHAVLKGECHRPTRKIAELAYAAGLWAEAARVLELLTQESFDRHQYTLFVELHRHLRICKRRAHHSVSLEQEVRYAQSLARIGRHREAERKLQSLLDETWRRQDTASRPLVLAALIQLERGCEGRRLSLIRSSIDSWTEASEKTLHSLYAALAAAMTSKGDFAEAQGALAQAETLAARETPAERSTALTAASGYLLLNLGRFDDALQVFQSIKTSGAAEAAVLTNISICLEHMGRLHEAYDAQSRGYGLTVKSSHHWGQVCCLSNLGSFKTKLGVLDEAEAHFEHAKKVSREHRGDLKEGVYIGVEAEEAALKAALGDYRVAIRQLSRAAACPRLFRVERLQAQIQLCHILLDLRTLQAPKRLIAQIRAAIKDGSELHFAQWTMLASRMEQDSAKAKAILQEGLKVACDSKLLYEECRLKLEYGRRTMGEGPSKERDSCLSDSINIAKRYGYVPLLVEGLMLQGLTSPSRRTSRKMLSDAFVLARQSGSALVQAHIGYCVANLLEGANHRVAARKWYFRSSSIIVRIGQGLPDSLRRSFLGADRWTSTCLKKTKDFSDLHYEVFWSETSSVVMDRSRIYFQILHEVGELSDVCHGPSAFLAKAASIINLRTPCEAFVIEYSRSTLRVTKPFRSEAKLVLKSVKATSDYFSNKVFNNLKWRESDKVWIPCSAHGVGLYVIFTKIRTCDTDKQFMSVLEKVVQESLSNNTENSGSADWSLRNQCYGLVGVSDAFVRLCDQIRRASMHSATVLIQGETGTGKELVAKAVHDNGSRRNQRFVPVDCGAIPDGLFESELFGIRRGSFTGSHTDRRGLAEEADNGTLFLDEISNLSLQSQAKLLRFLQQKTIRRLGETAERALDVRILAASNITLSQLVETGKFRADLYFRLNTVLIHVPPLSLRREDVIPLAHHFLRSLNTLHQTNRVFSATATSEINRRAFPGNVRELKNMVERCYYAGDNRVLEIPAEEQSPTLHEIESWFTQISAGSRGFWSSVYLDYRQRRISRQELRALIDHGLRATNGYYKALANRFNIRGGEYRRFMDFLRRNDCLLDFRTYRRS